MTKHVVVIGAGLGGLSAAAHLIGKGFYGVDLKSRDDKVYVIEVNDNPNVDEGVEDGVLGGALYERIMQSLVRRIEEYLKGSEHIDQEFMLVKFTEFNASSLDIFVYCFTKTTDWTKHLQVKQDVNLRVMELVEELGMGIAFPTRTVHLVGAPVESDAS